jgi:hypothetical protein
MPIKYVIAVLVLLAVLLPASPAQAGGVVTVCDEAHLIAALADGGTVTFTCSAIIILTAQIEILADTNIDGAGQKVTISGDHRTRLFLVHEGFALGLNKLALINGLQWDGGGILNMGGHVTVTNCNFSGNGVNYPFGFGGGAILNYRGSLKVNNSRFAHNWAFRVYGGAIENYGTAIVTNSTFLHNRAHAGGAIENSGELTVSNSTFHDNRANVGGAIAHSEGTTTISNSTLSGDGTTNTTCQAYCRAGEIVVLEGVVTVSNTIMANGLTGTNCDGPIVDGGGNISYPDRTCPGVNADPKLGPLQGNGGPTPTMALEPGSAAIDAGNPAACRETPVHNLDQRGVVRPQGPRCDIGAIEQLLPRAWLPALHFQ